MLSVQLRRPLTRLCTARRSLRLVALVGLSAKGVVPFQAHRQRSHQNRFYYHGKPLEAQPGVLPGVCQQQFNFLDTSNEKKTVLVVGDGDFSYSASVSDKLQQQGVILIASVLESRQVHEQIYRNSQRHVDTITAHSSHHVLFEMDATQLHNSFPPHSLDRIEFNFPHWRGKSNNRYNRQLINGFLHSASRVIKKDGEVHVALRMEQGGAHAKELVEWKRSWMAPEFAAQHGFLLRRLDPFEEEYNVSSYRGGDRPFFTGDSPQRYVFAFPNGEPLDRWLNLCSRHELRIMLQPESTTKSPYSPEELLEGDIILNLAQEIAPDGIHVEIPMKTRIMPTPGKDTGRWPLLVYLLVYCGERIPLTRQVADDTRHKLEQAAVERLGYPLSKTGRLVSKPFPYPALQQLIRDYS